MRLLRFVVLASALFWLAHAVAFFAHEYGHSFTAWALGWKRDPLRLNWGGPTPLNLAIMADIDEQVDYAPIFAAGAGAQAALIAAAGVLANLVLYVAAAVVTLRSLPGRPRAALVAYGVAVMCVGNFLDYVPTRCWSPSADMHTLERGLGVGPWAVTLGLGVPFLLGGLHLFLRLLPRVRRDALGCQRPWAVTGLTTFVIFVFFALAGFESSAGPVAQGISLTSIFVLFPLVTLLSRPRGRAPAAAR